MSRRPVVAFFNGNMYYPNYRALIRQIFDGFAHEDLNLHTYMGANLVEYFQNDFMRNLCIENHFHSVFSYSMFDRPDLIIIAMGGILRDGDESDVRQFLEQFSGIPILLLESAVESPDVYHILLENYRGMRELTEHLITKHDCKRLAHLAGPEEANDSRIRLQAFRDTLISYNLEPAGIAYGTFTPHVEQEVEELLNLRPDALLCANDYMAQTAYHMAQARGLRIGSEILITGFDDSPFAAVLDPSLTTVRQDYSLIAKTVVEETRRFLQGKPLRNVTVPAKVRYRESCGCISEKVTEEDIEQKKRFYDAELSRMMLQSVESSITLRNMMIYEEDEQAMFRQLGETLFHLGAKNSYILLLEHPVISRQGDEPVARERLRLVMKQEGDQVQSFLFSSAPVLGHGEFRKILSGAAPTRLTDFVLYYQEIEYGILTAEIDPDNMIFFYSLSLEIGSGLRFAQLSSEQRSAHTALEEQNQILSYAASHDELTGLYNRPGIMNEIFRFVRSYPKEHTFLLVMADLDHLKQINDCLGHNAGDIALKKVSEVLKRMLPYGSPVGRNGGDEFMAVVHIEHTDMEQELYSKIQNACETCDNTEQLPFYMGISMGMVRFQQANLSSFLQLIEQADQNLYQAKKKRREYVIR